MVPHPASLSLRPMSPLLPPRHRLSTIMSTIAPTDSSSTKLTKLRVKDFPIPIHSHGKAKVRVMKVVRTQAKHFCYEYSVDTILYSPTYERVFTKVRGGAKRRML